MKKAVFRAKYKEVEELKENLKKKEEVKEEYVEFKPVYWEGLKPPKVILQKTDVSTAKDPKGIKTMRKGKKKND